MHDIEKSKAVQDFRTAKGIYAQEGLFGSDHKDVIGADRCVVVGAEVISRRDDVKRGVVSVASPFEKRLGLATCSAAVAAFGFTSGALHASLVGSWVSVLTFRRQSMAVLNEVFKTIPPEELDTERPKLRHLSKAAAEELQILSALALIISSNISVPFSKQIFATDASTTMGGTALLQ